MKLTPLVRISAIALAILIGGFLILWFFVLFVAPTLLVLIEVFAAPIIAGTVAGKYWKEANIPTAKQIFASLTIVLLTCSLVGLWKIEGYICLIVVAPLLWAVFLIGAAIGTALAKPNAPKLNVSLAGIFLIVAMADLFSSHHYESMVSDTVVINAPADRVWKYVDSYPPIEEPQPFWLFQIGLPRPIATTVSAHQQNATRKCIFSNGVVFDERMSVYDSARELTFDITHQPADPEILGHLTLQKGQFLLTPNANGSTTVVGTSWYELHIFPAWYFDLWAQAITSNVHKAALEHIKRLAESGQ